jgi:DNA polymerase-3 subunit epsilon
MREIVLDTETTGLDPADGHRVVEVACVELMNLMPTGNELHFYCNPERDMPAEAMAVHGLSAEFLSTYPLFAAEAERFLAFMGDAALIAHNAEFDVRFLQAELTRCGRPRLTCPIIDTVQLARRKFPGASASLDALCRRFGIDLSGRAKHGALIDTRLLAKVYLELKGGQQPDLGLAARAAEAQATRSAAITRTARPARPHEASEAERAAHQTMVGALKDPLWAKVG